MTDERLREIANWRDGRKITSAPTVDEIQESCRELLALRQANRWIPVSERLPGDRKPVMVFTVGLSEPNGIRMSSYDVSQPASMYWHGFLMGKGAGVSHWRPLPAPPESK
jgi:hypothetical protein